MPRLPLFVAFVLAACATAPPQKMSWSEAMSSARVEPSVHVDSDSTFAAALQRFIDGGQVARRATAAGAAMPADQAAAWAGLLGSVDHFLTRPVSRTFLGDVARARLVLESELELDALAYGNIDRGTVEAAHGAMQRLSERLATVAAKRPRVDPRRFAWPVVPVVVTSPFGERVHPITGDWNEHRAVDLVAELGQPVKAAYAGTVTFAGWNGAHGKHVQLVHDGHWTTGYSHLSAWLVKPGQAVEKGEIIGFAGSTGQSTGPHVHFELLRDGTPVDPESRLPPVPDDGVIPLASR